MRNFKCLSCYKINNSEDWNDATISHYNDAITEIEDDTERIGCDYICPSCNKKIDGQHIEEVNE